MTLVEVLIGFFVIGTACMAGLAGLLFAYRNSDSNLCALTAASAVRSVGEQLVSVNTNCPNGSVGSMAIKRT
jgi:hypothetical protein